MLNKAQSRLESFPPFTITALPTFLNIAVSCKLRAAEKTHSSTFQVSYLQPYDFFSIDDYSDILSARGRTSSELYGPQLKISIHFRYPGWNTRHFNQSLVYRWLLHSLWYIRIHNWMAFWHKYSAITRSSGPFPYLELLPRPSASWQLSKSLSTDPDSTEPSLACGLPAQLQSPVPNMADQPKGKLVPMTFS